MSLNDIFNQISEISNHDRVNGGFYYVYTYFHQCARFKSNTILVESSKELNSKELSKAEIGKIEYLIKCGLWENHDDKITNDTSEYTARVVEELNAYEKVCVVEFEGDFTSASITIEAVSGNDGYKWEIDWILD